MKPLRSIDVQGMTNTRNVLAELKRNLSELRGMVQTSELVDPAERQTLSINTIYLKTFYERAERLIRDRVDTLKSS